MSGDRRLGEALRALRAEHGRSLDWVVERVNRQLGKDVKPLSKPTLHRAERGEATLLEAHIEAIAAVFGTFGDALPRDLRGGLFEAQLSAPQLRVALDQLDAAQEVLSGVTKDLEKARFTIQRGLGQRSRDLLKTLQIVPVGTRDNPLILSHEAVDPTISAGTAMEIARETCVRDPIVIVRNESMLADKYVALDGQTRLQIALEHADVIKNFEARDGKPRQPLHFLPAQAFELSGDDAGAVVLMTWHHACKLTKKDLLDAARGWDGCLAIEEPVDHRVEAMIEDGSAVATVFFARDVPVSLVLTAPHRAPLRREEQTLERRSRLLQKLAGLYAHSESTEQGRHRLALPGGNVMTSAKEIARRHESCVVFARWSLEEVIQLAIDAEKDPSLRLPHGITRTVVVEGRLSGIRVHLDDLAEKGDAAALRTEQLRTRLAGKPFRLFVESTQVYS